MKTSIFIVFSLMFMTVCFAQNNKDEVNYVQSLWGMEKRDIIKQQMVLSEKESADFWKVYDKYEDARKELGKERISTIMDYAENAEKLTDDKAEELATKMLANQVKFLDILNSAYSDMKAVIPKTKAFQFILLENYIDTALKLKIVSELPMISEKKK